MKTESHNLSCVVLMDIDGTLVTGPEPSPSPGMMAMDSSACQLTGLAGLHKHVEFAGRTDRQIARDLLRAGGDTDPSEDNILRLIDAYIDALEKGVMGRPYRTLGHARDAICALRNAGMVVGLGTGNVTRGAKIKLESAGLIDLFDLAMGGYGDDGETREELLIKGAHRCDPSGSLPIVIVGDTPHDVRAALGIGAYCIAVTTGFHDAEVLQAAGANVTAQELNAGIVKQLASLLENRE